MIGRLTIVVYISELLCMLIYTKLRGLGFVCFPILDGLVSCVNVPADYLQINESIPS